MVHDSCCPTIRAHWLLTLFTTIFLRLHLVKTNYLCISAKRVTPAEIRPFPKPSPPKPPKPKPAPKRKRKAKDPVQPAQTQDQVEEEPKKPPSLHYTSPDSLKFIKAHDKDQVAEDKRVADAAAAAAEAARKQQETGSQQQQQQPQQPQAPQAPVQVKQEPVDPPKRRRGRPKKPIQVDLTTQFE